MKTIGAIVIAATLAPLAFILWNGTHFFNFAHEFIAYRIGHALALSAGEGEFVRPVQGLPNALLSKWIVAVLDNPASYEGFQTYSLIFFGVVAGTLATLVAIGSLRGGLTIEQRLAFSLFLLVPWYVGGASIGLMLAPDYWIAEYLWLAASLLVVSRPEIVDDRGAALLGAWIGIGATIKISLGGAGLILLVTKCRSMTHVAITTSAALIAYIAVVVLYAGGDAPKLLAHQVGFFLYPNHSAIYSGVGNALMARPAAAVIACLALLAALFAPDFRLKIAALGALALNAYLIHKRPHDTSLTSAVLSMSFIAFAFGRLRINAPVLIVTASMLGFPAVQEWRTTARAAETDWQRLQRLSQRPGVWLMYHNRWNARLLPQAIGYNGTLALRPFDVPAKAFDMLFPGTSVAHATGNQLETALAMAKAGVALHWTEPADHASAESAIASEKLHARILKEGLSVQKTPFSINGARWTLWTAGK